MLGKTPCPPQGAILSVSPLRSVKGSESLVLTHNETKTQWKSSPVFREEECLRGLSQGARAIGFNQAIDTDKNHDYA